MNKLKEFSSPKQAFQVELTDEEIVFMFSSFKYGDDYLKDDGKRYFIDAKVFHYLALKFPVNHYNNEKEEYRLEQIKQLMLQSIRQSIT